MTLSDWTALGTGLGLAFVAFMQVYNNWKGNQRDKQIAKVVDMTNGTMGLQKRSLAEVTAAKAVITKDPMDVEAAKIAKADSDDHDLTTEKSNQEKP